MISGPVLVIGGGLAGGAAACRLALGGRTVELIERTAGPHDKICGEFLSVEAQQDLRRLGVEPGALGAMQIGRLRLVHRSRTTGCDLPFQGLSVSRRVLDEALLAQAARLGVTVRRGVTVRGLEMAGSQARLLGEPGWPGPIVLATGKHTLRGAARRVRPSRMIGLKMYARLSNRSAARLAGNVELHLFGGGYAGVEPVEGGRANLTLLVRKQVYAACGGDWRRLLGRIGAEDPSLDTLMEGAEPLFDRPLSIAGVPYGFMHQAAANDPVNLYRVGDQLAVIPSLTGDGMAIALRSGIEAAEAIVAGEAPAAFHAAYRAAGRRQMQAAQFMAGALQTRTGGAGLTWLAARMPGTLRWAVEATRLAR